VTSGDGTKALLSQTCPKTCNLCDENNKKVPTAQPTFLDVEEIPVSEECIDTGSYCLKYASYCDKADIAMVTSGDGTKALLSQACRKTCNLCEGPSDEVDVILE